MDSLIKNLNICQVKIFVSSSPTVTVILNKIVIPIKIENICRYKIYKCLRDSLLCLHFKTT